MPPFDAPFAATNEPGTCLWCGRALTQAKPYRGQRNGYQGSEFFCRLSCGFLFGMFFAGAGRRLMVKEEGHESRETV